MKIKIKNEENIAIIKIEGKDKLATKNLVRGNKVYGEKLIEDNNAEYRIWDPFRSKLASAIIKGLNRIPINIGSKVLYLGVSTGTTASHISDIIDAQGILFGVEIAPRVAREFVEKVARIRSNIVPILSDASKFERYDSIYGKVNLVYCDISHPRQTEIAIQNSKYYLESDGTLLLCIKASSIDVTKDPEQVFKEEIKKIEKLDFKISQIIKLEPYDKDHVMIVASFNEQ